MKGLSGEGQQTLLELKEHHGTSETRIIDALLKSVATDRRYSFDIALHLPKPSDRPYRCANLSSPKPRHSKYNFGDLIGSREGRAFTTTDFARTTDWIRANAYSFARRWHVVLKYEFVSTDVIHLWFFRPDDPLAQAKTIKELRRMIQREAQQQAVA